MSPNIVAHSPDLQRLHQEGFALRISGDGACLIVEHIPYVTPSGAVAYGTLVSALEQAGEKAANPVGDHSLWFDGETPCDAHGRPLSSMLIVTDSPQPLGGLTVRHRFSCKPPGDGNYPDYHAKITAYVNMLLTYARAVDANVTATLEHPIVLCDEDPDAPFVYPDTASARVEITAIGEKLQMEKVAIVGLGGTGSYILDQLAKTPVREIHLYDGDDFLNHNAFRAPGAASIEQLNEQPKKVDYLAARYSVMKRGIIAHPRNIDQTTVQELREMQFVFLAADGGEVKRLLIEKLEEFGVPFIDVGLAVDEHDGSLGAMIMVTSSTPAKRDHARTYIDTSSPPPEELYEGNIQVADLNALNAILAVIRWKKYCGFYRDLGHEHFSVYTLDRDQLDNAEHA